MPVPWEAGSQCWLLQRRIYSLIHPWGQSIHKQVACEGVLAEVGVDLSGSGSNTLKGAGGRSREWGARAGWGGESRCREAAIPRGRSRHGQSPQAVAFHPRGVGGSGGGAGRVQSKGTAVPVFHCSKHRHGPGNGAEGRSQRDTYKCLISQSAARGTLINTCVCPRHPSAQHR